MGRRARLQELLGKRFTDSKELRAFVDDTFGIDAVNSIGWEEGVNDETSDLIRWLQSRGKMAELWPALKSAFPNFVDEIDALALEWKPSAIARIVPAPLVRWRVQIGVGAALVAAIALVVILVWPDPPPPKPPASVVVILDRDAREVIGTKDTKPSLFVLHVDGHRFPIPWSGLSFGAGPALPSELAERYLAEGIVDAIPRKEDFVLPAAISSLDVRYELSKPRTCQPRLLVNGDNKLWLVKRKECQ